MDKLNILNSFLTIMVTFGVNVKAPSALELLPMSEIFNKIIYDQELKNLVEKLRQISDQNERAEFKQKNLPYFSMSTFENKRSKNNFISTQAMVFDLDHLDDVEEIKSYLSKWKYSSAVFISPSGNGLKLIVKLSRSINSNSEYTKIYEAIINLIENELPVKLDRSTKDSARACFLSHDPNLFFNENAESFNVDDDELLNEIISIDAPPKLPLSKSKEIKEILVGVEEGRRHSSMMQLIGAYIKQKLTKSQILQSLQAWNLLNKPPLEESELLREFERAYKSFSKNNQKPFREFWSHHEKKGIQIEQHELMKFLEDNGFYKMKFGFDTYEYVRIEGHIISKVSITDIQEFIISYIEKNVEESTCFEILNKIVSSAKDLFIKTKFNFLTTINPEMVNDTQSTAFLFFNDKFIEITNETINIREYGTLFERYIWRDNFIPSNCSHFKLSNFRHNSIFDKLVRNITRKENEWYNALVSSLGYLLHNYKNPAKTKAIIFCDEAIPVGNTANGGSGKSLVCSSLKYLRKSTIIDGKNYKTDSRFTFQKIEPNTEIVILDDVRKDFDFESLLSAITSDLIIERKFKDPITVPFKDAPKFIITTNYTINGDGNSFDRRKLEIEFSNYYHKGLTPEMEFGHRLFDDWNKEEWDKFYITIIYYLHYYLKNGLQTYSVKNLPIRKIINSTCPDFYDFMESNFKLNKEYNKSDLVNDFKFKYPENSLMSSRKFTAWLSSYADILNYELSERSSNGSRYIFISDPNNADAVEANVYQPITDYNAIIP